MTEQIDHKGFAEIVKAIAKATGEVKRLAKDNKNTEQKYEFASVDDFLAMTGPILAANGLVILMDEVGCENVEKQGKYGVTQWAKYTYVFEVMHESGQMLRPVTRTVEVIRSGAQASGSAQSYALKQFERSLLQIPTGDKDDPDHGEKAEPVSPRQEPRHIQLNARDQIRPEQLAIRAAVDSLGNSESMDQLAAIWGDLPRDVQMQKPVIDAKDKAKARLANESVTEDKIPY